MDSTIDTTAGRLLQFQQLPGSSRPSLVAMTVSQACFASLFSGHRWLPSTREQSKSKDVKLRQPCRSAWHGCDKGSCIFETKTREQAAQTKQKRSNIDVGAMAVMSTAPRFR